jgi:hypothetical protein
MKKQNLNWTAVIPHMPAPQGMRNPKTPQQWIPAGRNVAKGNTAALRLPRPDKTGLAMTEQANMCHCAESIRDDKAIFALETSPCAGMTRRYFCSYLIILLVILTPQQGNASNLGNFEMTIKQDNIYTPGKINLTMKPTDPLTIEGSYQFRISIYSAGTLIRQQNISAVQKEPATFSIEFPEVQAKTDGRCRCELFIGEQFISSQEKPITLWPSIAAYPDKAVNNRVIWTYDTSGKLNELFKKMEVKTADAIFQAVRDFGKPDIVFIGQQLDPNSISVITGRLSALEPKPVAIWLRQKQLPYNSKIEIPAKDNTPANVKYDKKSPLLTGLNERDIISLAANSCYIKIKNENISVGSFVSEAAADDKYILSYLCSIEDKGGLYTIYCQLPVIDDNDPRGTLLLGNLLKFADKKVASAAKK